MTPRKENPKANTRYIYIYIYPKSLQTHAYGRYSLLVSLVSGAVNTRYWDPSRLTQEYYVCLYFLAGNQLARVVPRVQKIPTVALPLPLFAPGRSVGRQPIDDDTACRISTPSRCVPVWGSNTIGRRPSTPRRPGAENVNEGPSTRPTPGRQSRETCAFPRVFLSPTRVETRSRNARVGIAIAPYPRPVAPPPLQVCPTVARQSVRLSNLRLGSAVTVRRREG